MAWELRAIVLGGIFLLGAAPPPAASVDLNAPSPPSLMTGTVAERNDKISAMLEKPTGKIEQLSFQDLAIGTAIQLLTIQTRFDIRPDWAALEKVGVTRETPATASLYDATVPQVLRFLMVQARPPKGQLIWKVEDGVLAIVPTEDETPPRETDAEKKLDLAADKLLKEPLNAGDILGKEVTLDMALRLLSSKKKLIVLPDWRELKVVNITPDLKVTLDTTDPTGEGYLKAVFAKLKPVGGTMSYDFRWGMLRISTAERLAKEKKLAAAAEEASKLP